MNLPDCVTQEDWEDWLEDREQLGPYSDVAKKRFLMRCERYHNDGYDVSQLIGCALEMRWKTIFPRDDMKRKRDPRETMVTDITAVVQDKDAARKGLEEAKQKVFKRT